MSNETLILIALVVGIFIGSSLYKIIKKIPYVKSFIDFIEYYLFKRR